MNINIPKTGLSSDSADLVQYRDTCECRCAGWIRGEQVLWASWYDTCCERHGGGLLAIDTEKVGRRLLKRLSDSLDEGWLLEPPSKKALRALPGLDELYQRQLDAQAADEDPKDAEPDAVVLTAADLADPDRVRSAMKVWHA